MAYNEDGTLWHNADMYLDYKHRFDLIDFWCLNATFNNISDISWRPVLVLEEAGEPPTMGKQLVNFITCGCESSAPFL
jgi:hypothetical protein